MNLVARHSRKELWVTLSIWAVLMLLAVVGLLLLKSNALRIIDHIHYVNVGRGAKASVLYAEAEKHAKLVLEKAENLNRLSGKKYVVPKNNEHLQKSVALFNQAFEVDIRDEFAPERTMYYELLGQVHDAAGDRNEQLLAHTRALLAQRDSEDALDYIHLLRQASPKSPEPLLLLAQLHALNNETTEAMTTLDELYTSYTVTPKARWVKSQILTRTGKTDEAVSELQKAVEQSPQDLTYRHDLGNVLARLNDKRAAVQVMEAGLDDGGWLDPAYLHIYGNYLTDNEDFEEAIRVLKQADELAPNSGDVQWSLAKAYHLAGQPKLADSALRRATQIKPELHDQIF